MKEYRNSRRRRKVGNRQRLGNRMAIIGITIVVFCLGVVVNIKSASMKKKDLVYQIREEALLEQVQNEQDRAVELENFRVHVQNKQYIEEVAKQKLGLVNPDEILLKPAQK